MKIHESIRRMSVRDMAELLVYRIDHEDATDSVTEWGTPFGTKYQTQQDAVLETIDWLNSDIVCRGGRWV